MSAEPSPARSSKRRERSSWPVVERCSSTKSAICRPICRRNCFVFFKSGWSNVWGGREEIAVDVRVICATHRDLGRLVAEGLFREDLFYRLCEISIAIPSLRDRPGDAVQLARHFLREFTEELGAREKRLGEDALVAIDAYEWPGNVRELQNRIKRAIILSPSRNITRGDLDLADPQVDDTALNLRRAREQAETVALRRVLARTKGNISKAAKLLGVSRPTLYDLMRQHHLRD